MHFNYNKFLGFSFSSLIKYYFQTKFEILKYYLKFILPNRKILKETIKIKNSKKGKKVFIFGSGPSMNLIDPEKISNLVKQEGYEVIALNSFLYSEFANYIKPNYMVFSDPLDFIEVPDTHPRFKRSIDGKIDKRKAINNNIPLFIPISFYKHSKKDHGKVYYFNDSCDYFSQKIDLLKPRPFNTFTGLKAIACGVYMGYDEIYICGFDYDSFKKTVVDINNEIIHEFGHYYESENRPNHFVHVKRSFGSHLYDCALVFIQHDKFKKYNITNLNKLSFIDSFKKKHNLDVYLKKD